MELWILNGVTSIMLLTTKSSPPVQLWSMYCTQNWSCRSPSSGVLPPHLFKPPSPCGATSSGGATAQRQASTSVHRHRFTSADQDGGAPAVRHQPEPKHQQRNLPLPRAEASDYSHAKSGSPSYLCQPPVLQGPSAVVSAAIQARPQRQQWQQQAHLSVRELFCDRGPTRPALLPRSQ